MVVSVPLRSVDYRYDTQIKVKTYTNNPLVQVTLYGIAGTAVIRNTTMTSTRVGSTPYTYIVDVTLLLTPQPGDATLDSIVASQIGVAIASLAPTVAAQARDAVTMRYLPNNKSFELVVNCTDQNYGASKYTYTIDVQTRQPAPDEGATAAGETVGRDTSNIF